MKEQDIIKELFSEKLGNYQPKVNPELWANISSQVAATGTTAATGISVLSKVIIGISITAAVTVTSVLLLSKPANNQEIKEKQQAEEVITKETIVDQNITTAENTQPELSTDKQIPVFEQEDVNRIENEDLLLVKEDIVQKEHITVEENKVLYQETNQEINPLIEEDVKSEDVVENMTIKEDTQELEFTEDVKKIELFNVFTPNGDNNNDYLYIKSEGLSDFNVVVLNRSNQVVFQSNNPDFKWYGIGIDGTPVPAGNYVYFVTAINQNGLPINEHSSLSIIR